MTKKILKSIKQTKPKTLTNFKVTEDELKVITRNAKKFAKGNVSEWIRFSSMNFIPSDKDLKILA